MREPKPMRCRSALRAGALALQMAGVFFSSSRADAAEPPQKEGVASMATGTFRLVVHGGAGTLPKDKRTPEVMAAYREAIAEALRKGHQVLAGGGAALDAVVAAITVLEDAPQFNAGKGAVFTSAGTNELDAAIMDGATLKAGSVAGLKRIRNPIHVARLVMDRTKHVLLIGEGAELLAREQGLEWVDPSYFHTERRWKELQEAKDREKQRIGDAGPEEIHYGTVGAVALDRSGHLAAGTSTGGTTNKRPGRVGDSPIIGSGTYADDRTCAVSATGQGEYFMRAVVAHDVCALVDYKKMSLGEAAEAVIGKVGALGGQGGLIALDGRGTMAMPFNTEGMYRGSIGPDGQPSVAIDKE
jgi:L-asparaginase / beta-aspartyl-peptidase